MKPEISVLMPVYNQAHFLSRSLESLINQTFSNWELIVIDDGSTDDLLNLLEAYQSDERIRVFSLGANVGLGASLNLGLEQAKAKVISYLPCDDVYYANHLFQLWGELQKDAASNLSFSGVRHHYNKYCRGQIEGYSLQLVQIAHRCTNLRWKERTEFVSDNLNWLMLDELREQGNFVGTNEVSCEWTAHPGQLSRLIREPYGGINPFRSKFGIKHPIRFRSTYGNLTDEFRQKQEREQRTEHTFVSRAASADGKGPLKILMVGELAYNADRILSLEERGHELYGLWINDPDWYNTVGPLPFGAVETIGLDDWEEKVKVVKPDVVYALLNWKAVSLAHQVLMKNLDIPFVWHFKEGPFICLEKGLWKEMRELALFSSARIFCSEEQLEWFHRTFLIKGPSYVLDGDLPPRSWFTGDRKALLSEKDQELHTVVVGRPIGMTTPLVHELFKRKIHLHLYGDFIQKEWREWIEAANQGGKEYLHCHPHVGPEDWLTELSQYDLGWLHIFDSRNKGDLLQSDWDDLNIPARMATYAVAGVPFVQKDNQHSRVAMDRLARSLKCGFHYSSFANLFDQMSSPLHLKELRENLAKSRFEFCFDHHVDRLIVIFRSLEGR